MSGLYNQIRQIPPKASLTWRRNPLNMLNLDLFNSSVNLTLVLHVLIGYMKILQVTIFSLILEEKCQIALQKVQKLKKSQEKHSASDTTCNENCVLLSKISHDLYIQYITKHILTWKAKGYQKQAFYVKNPNNNYIFNPC